jgi:hypothetical protein
MWDCILPPLPHINFITWEATISSPHLYITRLHASNNSSSGFLPFFIPRRTLALRTLDRLLFLPRNPRIVTPLTPALLIGRLGYFQETMLTIKLRSFKKYSKLLPPEKVIARGFLAPCYNRRTRWKKVKLPENFYPASNM